MRNLVAVALGVIIACTAAGCKKKPEVNSVDLEQINVDDSNDYRYIFRDTIQEQKERESRYKKKEF